MQAIAPAQLFAQAQDLLRAGHMPEALSAWRRVHGEFGLRDRATLLNLGFCLEHEGELENAIGIYLEAVRAEPGFFEAHVNLAGVLWRIGEFQRALAHAQAAVHVAPNHPAAVRILGTTLLQLNRVDEAELQLRRALALDPSLAVARFDLAFCLLLAGRLEEGWAEYERRWDDTARLQRPPFFQPSLEWQGPAQPLAGRRLLVYAEQGLGDTVQFLRYLPQLQALGAKVTVAVQSALAPLVEASFPGVDCLVSGRPLQADLHAALLDLPGHFGTGLDTIPAATPYLRAPETHRQAWAGKLSAWKGRKVGIAWSGLLRQVNNRNRAVPLSLWAPLLALPGVQAFSLQKADAGPFTDGPRPPQLVDMTGKWRDFNDSAAMIESLDLVVTVDTVIAHLAGALGKPVLLLLPPNPDFRWLLDRDDSPWYPGMQLFRRGPEEPRQAQMARVVQAARSLLGV